MLFWIIIIVVVIYFATQNNDKRTAVPQQPANFYQPVPVAEEPYYSVVGDDGNVSYVPVSVWHAQHGGQYNPQATPAYQPPKDSPAQYYQAEVPAGQQQV